MVTIQCSLVAAVIRGVSMSSRPSFAVAGATVVHFDVLGSVGDSLRMDFGDGTWSSSPGGCIPTTCLYFEHTYSPPVGTRTAVLTVSDSGRQSTASRSVLVSDLSGTWANTISNPTNNLTETRLLVLVGGGSFTGSYVHPAGNSEPLTGTVNEFGTVRLRLDGGSISMQGVDLDHAGLLDDTSMRLTVTGGSANGMTLTFSRR